MQKYAKKPLINLIKPLIKLCVVLIITCELAKTLKGGRILCS